MKVQIPPISYIYFLKQCFQTSQLSLWSLIELFLKTRNILKNKLVNLCKGHSNTKIKIYFPKVVNRFSFTQSRPHSFMAQLHMAHLEMTLFISTYQLLASSVGNRNPFLWSDNTIFLIGLSNSHFEFLFPGRSPIRNSSTNLFLSLLTPITLALYQWFLKTFAWLTMAILPTLKFLFLLSHF